MPRVTIAVTSGRNSVVADQTSRAARRHRWTFLPRKSTSFAVIASQLTRRRGGGIPWRVVVLGVVIVTIAVTIATLLGVHHHLASLFYGTFVVALAVGLWATVLVDSAPVRSSAPWLTVCPPLELTQT